VRALVVAPGGRVWSAGDDHLVAIADLRTGAVLARIVDAAGPVLSLAMAGEYIWSGSADRHIRCHHQQVMPLFLFFVFWFFGFFVVVFLHLADSLQSARTVRDLSAHQAWVTALSTTPTTLWR
jgi:hypothetical protein